MSRIKEDVAKILILGDSRVGKSSILARYCDGTFTEIMTTTIGNKPKTFSQNNNLIIKTNRNGL